MPGASGDGGGSGASITTGSYVIPSVQKIYFARVYSPTVSGTTTSGLISTLKDFEWRGFTWNMNAGMGETKLRFARSINDFDEGNEIQLFGQFDIYVHDRESGHGGRLVYSGYVIDYTPTIVGHEESVEVTLWGYATEFAVKVLENEAGETNLTYNSQDPSNIFKDVLRRYDGKIQLLSANVETTATSVSVVMKQNSILEAIQQCIKVSPVNWYWRSGPENQIELREKNADVIDHTLTIGKDISSLKMTRSAKDFANMFYFLGGGVTPLYVKSSRSASQTLYGRRAKREQDERVTSQSTAAIIAGTYLDFYDHPFISAEVVVADSNGDARGGYDIELFKPGQIVKINDPRQNTQETRWDVAFWDISFWDFSITSAIGVPWQITSVRYDLESAILTLSYEVADFSKRIEDIKRNLELKRLEDSPNSPTSV